MRDLVKAKHVVGNHTLTHPLLTFKTSDELKAEFTGCTNALTDAIGEHSNLFRPPFGGRRPAVLRMARHMGLEPIMWNVTAYDWQATSAEQIEQKVIRRVRGGNVILLHDGGHKGFGADRSYTVMATDRLISRYKSEGYEFVTIPEMMGRQLSVVSLQWSKGLATDFGSQILSTSNHCSNFMGYPIPNCCKRLPCYRDCFVYIFVGVGRAQKCRFEL